MQDDFEDDGDQQSIRSAKPGRKVASLKSAKPAFAQVGEHATCAQAK